MNIISLEIKLKIVFYLLLPLLFARCIGQGNQIPTTIVRNNPFLKVTMSLNVIDKNTIIDTITYSNISRNDTIVLEKDRLPLNGSITKNIFAIMSIKTSKNVSFKDCSSRYPLDDDKPISQQFLNPDNFIFLLPQAQLSLSINLAKEYNFQPFFDSNDSNFAIVPNAYFPAITTSFKQVFEKDTDSSYYNKLKPVFYWTRLSDTRDTILKRVYFSIKR